MADSNWIKSSLELNSVSVWIDEDILPGESIPGAINRGLEKCRHVILVMTPEYFVEDAEWPAAEWHAALFTDPDGQRSRVIPIHLKNCPSMPPLLRHLSWLDFRDEKNFKPEFDKLVRIIQGRPSSFHRRIAGQVIMPTGNIARETLIAERASVDGRPDKVMENLASNLLPALRIPQYIWSIPLKLHLAKKTENGLSFPRKKNLINIIREWQENEKFENIFTPVFTRHGDSVWTLHDPSRKQHPLTPIVEDIGAQKLTISKLLLDSDNRNVVTELLMMCINRHCYRLGMVQDEKERFLFPSRDGGNVSKSWKLQKQNTRTVTKRFERDDGTTNFYYHEALYLKSFYFGNKYYLRLKPTIAFSDGGTESTILTGARVGPLAMNWNAMPKNIDVFRDIRFWIYQLSKGQSALHVHAGDQELELDTQPAIVRLGFGIADDQSNIDELIERLPPVSGERNFSNFPDTIESEEIDADL